MQISFTKMQGAGNDFVVLDETRGLLGLSAAQYRFLADRHFGVGADQILSVRAAPGGQSEIDFSYVIHNADGGEVEHCGNGARCFLQFVRERGLSQKTRVKVQTCNRVLELVMQADGGVTVDMGAPSFEAADSAFDAQGLGVIGEGAGQLFELNMPAAQSIPAALAPFLIAVVSMGNPHAVHRVDEVERWDMAQFGPAVQSHPRFASGVNAGFMQVISPLAIALRVYERGAGETLACGSGACAAVAAGVQLGWLQAGAPIEVSTHGGKLKVSWDGRPTSSVFMTGPATTVFVGEIELPE
jgi:diaminopimelate epimerase